MTRLHSSKMSVLLNRHKWSSNIEYLQQKPVNTTNTQNFGEQWLYLFHAALATIDIIQPILLLLIKEDEISQILQTTDKFMFPLRCKMGKKNSMKIHRFCNLLFQTVWKGQSQHSSTLLLFNMAWIKQIQTQLSTWFLCWFSVNQFLTS